MATSTKRVIVPVERREARGSNHARRLRAAGQVPGNVYGLDVTPFAVSVDPRRVEEVLRQPRGRNTIFNLALGGGEQSREVMLRELQRDPVSERLVHVDFLRIDAKQEIHVDVPVHLVGTAEGVKNEGGVLDFVHRTVNVSCLPADIPEYFEVDVSSLHVGQNVALSDITAPTGVTFLDDAETIIATVAMPRVEAEPEEAEEAAEGEEAAATEDEAKAEGEDKGEGE